MLACVQLRPSVHLEVHSNHDVGEAAMKLYNVAQTCFFVSMRSSANGKFPFHTANMYANVVFGLLLFVSLAAVLCHAKDKSGLQIGVKKRPDTCDMRTKKGDKLSMHYTVRFCRCGIL